MATLFRQGMRGLRINKEVIVLAITTSTTAIGDKNRDDGAALQMNLNYTRPRAEMAYAVNYDINHF